MRTAKTEGTSPPDSDASDRAAPSTGSSLALRNWRVRTRLIALILIPTTVAVLLGVLRVTTSVTSAAQFERVRTVAELVDSLGTFVHDFQLERDRTARYVAAGRPQGATLVEIRNQQDAVDTAVNQVRAKATAAEAALGTNGQQALRNLLGSLNGIAGLRDTAVRSQIPSLPTIEKYSLVVKDALALYGEVVQGSTNEVLTGTAGALSALARAEEEASKQRALLASVLARRQRPLFELPELDALTAAQARQASEVASFQSAASLTERQLYSDTVTGQRVDRAEALKARAITLARANRFVRRLDTVGQDSERWFTAISDTIDKMYTVEQKLSQDIIRQSNDLQSSDQGVAALNVVLVAGLLLLVLLVTSLMARSLVRPLRRLRTEALEVAGHRLPSLVQRLREGDATAGVSEVLAIGVASDDEIGEVARAFDEVHREAVRLASDEAALRSNISSMFVNLSRRTQTLVERQITLIDGLEQGEQDENRLGNLFKLDHLATRMRRNSENLLVLAGQEPARRWSQPVPLVDVVRASLSEVENYERVDMQIPPAIAVAGQAVNDVIHLLAELVENAISFSSRDTKVIVTGNRIDGGGVMIGITDNGIGMTGQELSQANWRLSNPPVVDVSVSRRMGLFVVGRLALRHGVRVQLRPHDAGGLTAMVLLPEQLIGLSATAAPYAPPALAGSLAAAPVAASSWDRPAELGQTRFGSPPPALDRAPAHPGVLQGFDSPPPAMPGQSFGPPGLGQGFGSPPPAMPGQGFDSPVSSPNFGSPPPAMPGQGFDSPLSSPNFGSPPPAMPGSNFDSPLSTQNFGAPLSQGQGQGFGGPPPPMPNQNFGGAPPGQGYGGSSAGQGFGTPPAGGPGQGFGTPPPPLGGSGRLRQGRFDFPDTDIASTGPMPVVHDSPLDQQGDEFLPIFASVESAWFRRAPATPPSIDTTMDSSVSSVSSASPASSVTSGGWRASSADAGWEAAAVVKEPVREGKTASGLPKRVPKANLVPGSVDMSKQTSPAPPMPPVSPDRVRNRLASFQQGIRQGRAVTRGELSEEEAYPGAMQSRADDNKEDA